MVALVEPDVILEAVILEEEAKMVAIEETVAEEDEETEGVATVEMEVPVFFEVKCISDDHAQGKVNNYLV